MDKDKLKQEIENPNSNQNGGSTDKSANSVSVAVRVRPRNAREIAENAGICVSLTPGEPQITIGRDKAFTYDHVFGEHIDQQGVYDACVHGLVQGTFEGYNATVLAYGQTGSGKTYTMGTSFDTNHLQSVPEQVVGIIPRAAKHLFDGIEERRKQAEKNGQIEPSFEVSVQFIELYNEDVIDLLSEVRNTCIKIHEDPARNEIYLKGAVWQKVTSAKDILLALKSGALNRTTAATNMNQQSSRSHAIFTVQLRQTRVSATVGFDEDGQPKPTDQNGNGSAEELEVVHAKFHFVDLAGSERLKRTGATGDRAKEGISINSGLLALGNVISALGGGSGSKVSHVPYRDSKLTRLLQDSLGGNSRTLMIACASPSDVDFVETLNTLNYANRAKNIKNKVVQNQDKSSKQIVEYRARIATLEARIATLETELQEYRRHNRVPRNGDDFTATISGPNAYLDKLKEEIGEENNEELDEKGAIGDEQAAAGDGVGVGEEEAFSNDENAGIDEEEEDDDEVQKHSIERDRIYGDLDELQGDINVKERLIAELETNKRKLEKTQQDYERKLAELGERIQHTEAERDKILSQMSAKKPEKQQEKEEIRKVREQYEKLLSELRLEHRRLQLAERENKKMQQENEKKQAEVNRIKQDVENLKHQKVELMNRLKEENRRIREIQQSNAKRVATYEKTQRQQQNRIQKLEREANMKTDQLRRKNEEMQRMKERQKMVQQRRQTIFEPHVPKVQSTPIRTKRQWSAMERAIEGLVTKKNAIARVELAMERQIQERARLQAEMLRLESNCACTMDQAERQTIREQQKSIQANLDYIQDELQRTQCSIVELDQEAVEQIEPPKHVDIPSLLEQTIAPIDDLDSLMARFTNEFGIPEDCQYILRNIIQMTIEKGHELAKLQAENKEMTALLGIEENPTSTAPEVKNVRQLKQRQKSPPVEAFRPVLDDLHNETFLVGNRDVASSSISSATNTTMASSSPILAAVPLPCAEQRTTGKYLIKAHTAQEHKEHVYCLHATERQMISGSKDRTAIVWDLESGKCVSTLANHPNNVKFVHLMSDGHTALTSAFNIVKVWDLRTAHCVHHLNSSGLREDGANEPINRLKHDQMPTSEKPIYCAAVDPIREDFLLTSFGNEMRVWDFRKLDALGTIWDMAQSENAILSMDLMATPTGEHFVATMAEKSANVGIHRLQNLREPHSAQFFQLKPAHQKQVTALCFTQNALFTAGKDSVVMRFSTRDFKRDHVEVLAPGEKPITAMCALPTQQSTFLATGCRGGSIKLWDVGSSLKMRPLETIVKAHNLDAKMSALCANSRLLFSANNEDKSVIFWSLALPQ